MRIFLLIASSLLPAALAFASTTAAAADPVAATRTALRAAVRDSDARPRPPLLSRAALLTPPAIGDVRLSPDGARLAVLRHDAGRVDVDVHDIATGRETRALSGATQVRVDWAGDGARLWIADAHGLAVFDVAKGTASRVLKWDVRRRQRLWHVDPRAPAFAIVHEQAPVDDDPGAAVRHRYLRVDARGGTRLLHEAARPLAGLLLHADGRLAYTAAFDGPDYDVAIRRHAPAGTRELMRCTGVETCALVDFDADGDVAVLSQHGEDTLALRRWRDADARWVTVQRDPVGVGDADALLWSRARGDWLAVRYGGGASRWVANDASTRDRIAALQAAMPGAALDLSASADGRRWLVRARHATWTAPRQFLVDAGGEPRRLFADAADPAGPAAPIAATSLAPMHPVSWRARDGRLLHGWVLLPPGVPAATAPLVAWLHGGPVAHVDEDYDPRLQLLANRGVVVFVPNFRGSTGHGVRYLLAAKGEVGDGPVLADVVDGLDFLLAAGIGDRGRQALMGHSFGGYLALLGASHRPGRFDAVFAAAPPTDYGWIKQWQADHDTDVLRGDGPPLALQFAKVGFPFTDPAWRRRMREQSPLANVGAVQVPVYLWAGAKDPKVPLPSIAPYAAAVRRQAPRWALLVDPVAGHSPDAPLPREALVYLMELAAHRELGGRLEPPSPALRAFVGRHLRRDDAAAAIARKSPDS